MTTTTDHTQASDLREYVRILRARKMTVSLIVLAVLAATMFFTFRQTPIYEAVAKIVVNPVQSPGGVSSQILQPNVETESEIVHSQLIAQMVQKKLAPTLSPSSLLSHLKVSVVTGTAVLLVKYDDPDPATTARLANGFAQAYVEFKSNQTQSAIQAQLAAFQRRIDGVTSRLADLTSQIDATKDHALLRTLVSQRDSLVAQLGALNGQLLNLQAQSSTQIVPAQIVQQADVPASPVSPNKVANGILALLVGLVLGVVVAFVQERLDDRVKSRQELERRLGAPVLAAVPRVNGWRKQEEAQLLMRSDPKSPVSEAYRTLATNIQYIASRQGLKVIMVTSALGGEGKTTTISNLAIALAQTGRRVILVSADLRRPRIHRFFEMSNQPGLSDVLSAAIDLSQVTADPGIPNLRVINAGPAPQNPAGLLGSERARDFLESLSEVADFILIDTPPVLAVADASVLAPLVDGTIFVMDADHSSRSAMTQSRDQLQNAGAEIIGAVYNNFDPNQSSSYPYYYYNYYHQYDSDEGPWNGDRRRGVRSRQRRRSSSFRPEESPASSNGKPGSRVPERLSGHTD